MVYVYPCRRRPSHNSRIESFLCLSTLPAPRLRIPSSLEISLDLLINLNTFTSTLVKYLLQGDELYWWRILTHTWYDKYLCHIQVLFVKYANVCTIGRVGIGVAWNYSISFDLSKTKFLHWIKIRLLYAFNWGIQVANNRWNFLQHNCVEIAQFQLKIIFLYWR